MNLLFDALIGTALGVSLAAPPGPITSMIIRKAMASILGSLIIGFGAMTADFILLIVTFFLHLSFDLTSVLSYVYLLGAGFLIYLAYKGMKSAGSEGVGTAGSFAKGLTIGLVNPAQIGWWLTAGLGFLEKFGLPVFYFLFLGTTLWVLFLSYLVHEGTRVYGERAGKIISLVSVLILLVFAGYFIYEGTTILLY